MNDTQQGATSASSQTGESAQVGYGPMIRERLACNPQFRTASELAILFHEVVSGSTPNAPTLPRQQQEARFKALSQLTDVREFASAAGVELTRMHFSLDGLALRFTAQIARIDLAASQGQAAARDLDRVGKLLDMVVKVQREARLCLSASLLMAHDLRALNMGEVQGGGSHSDE